MCQSKRENTKQTHICESENEDKSHKTQKNGKEKEKEKWVLL